MHQQATHAPARIYKTFKKKYNKPSLYSVLAHRRPTFSTPPRLHPFIKNTYVAPTINSRSCLNIKFYKRNNSPLSDVIFAHRRPTFNTLSGL